MSTFKIKVEILGRRFRWYRWQEDVVLLSEEKQYETSTLANAESEGNYMIDQAWDKCEGLLTTPESTRLEVVEQCVATIRK